MAMRDTNTESIDLRYSFESAFKILKNIDLPREFFLPNCDFFELLDRRRSRREFYKINDQKLSSLLWFAQRHTGYFPNQRVTTPMPTFGGLASVRTLVLTSDLNCWIYDPENHSAKIIESDNVTKKAIRKEVDEFFPLNDGALLLFAASESFVRSHYADPVSLVLRESGILIATLALIAEAFELSFCPLGTLGQSWLISLSNTCEKIIIPAGAAVIGSR